MLSGAGDASFSRLLARPGFLPNPVLFRKSAGAAASQDRAPVAVRVCAPRLYVLPSPLLLAPPPPPLPNVAAGSNSQQQHRASSAAAPMAKGHRREGRPLSLDNMSFFARSNRPHAFPASPPLAFLSHQSSPLLHLGNLQETQILSGCWMEGS